MSLPTTIERCRGQMREVPPGEWPFPSMEAGCVSCLRRTAGVADYMAGAEVKWMEAPAVRPCPEVLLPKKERHA